VWPWEGPRREEIKEIGMFSSFYVGATGIKAHSQGMSVLGNNISNVNTVAYKSKSTLFSDLMSQGQTTDTPTDVGVSQTGKGVVVTDIRSYFEQGSIKSNNSETSMAINGKGYFQVKSGDTTRYTRAGNFTFDKNGYLKDPNGFVLQGTSLLGGASGGTLTDIHFDPGDDGIWAVEATPTSEATVLTNLSPASSQETTATATSLATLIAELNGEDNTAPSAQASQNLTFVAELAGSDNTSVSNAAFFSLAQSWNGQNDPPLAADSYAHSETLDYLDADGNTRSVTIYMDKVTTQDGTPAWEYVVAADPAEETRDAFTGTASAGLLMAGTLTLNQSTGEIDSMSGFTHDGLGDPADLASWTPSGFSGAGYPEFTVTHPDGSTQTLGLNLGLANTGASWNSAPATAADVTGLADLPAFNATRESLHTTQGSGSTQTVSATHDGVDADDVFFGLADAYDASASPPLGQDAYAYSTTITVYDDAGNAQDLTVYFDKVTADSGDGNTYWEYVVATDPANDTRTTIQNSSKAGMLLAGTLTFDANGELVGQSGYAYEEGGSAADPESLQSWSRTGFTAEQAASA
jgi:flagellar hook protein FlgE